MGSETALARRDDFSDDKVALIKRTVAQGTTNDELELFLYTAKRTGLDPLANQIHAVKRWNAAAKRETLAIQVGIDGYRLIADRTGKYAPGPEPSFVYDDGQLVTATAYVKKLTADGTWHIVAATAHYSEYCGKKRDGNPNHMWANKPHIMLGKCAEALALRRAFPAELSGVYTREEMDQADNPPVQALDHPPGGPRELPDDNPMPDWAEPAEPPPPEKPKTSNARKKVNTALWESLWDNATRAGMNPDEIWEAVWARRDDLRIDGRPGKGAALRVVAQLTEADFIALNEGANAMRAALEAEQAELNYDRDTGECREPGCDDEG